MAAHNVLWSIVLGPTIYLPCYLFIQYEGSCAAVKETPGPWVDSELNGLLTAIMAKADGAK